MKCEVYRGSRKEETYLFVANAESLKSLPEVIRRQMGDLQLVMAIDLATRKSLAAADPADVIESIHRQGFYLQLPPGKDLPSC